jgi:hypothetical protein
MIFLYPESLALKDKEARRINSIHNDLNKVYENAWRRPITTGLLLASNNPEFSDDSKGKSFRSFKDVQDIWDSTGGKPGDKGIGATQALVEIATHFSYSGLAV